MNRPIGWCLCSPRECAHGKEWIVQQELDLLKPDHWMDWSYTPLVPSNTHTPMLWTGYQAGVTGIVNRMASAETGETALLFNEPERPEQAHMTPAAALDWTQAFLRAMWDTGKEFQWCAPGISINMRDYDGLAWLTEYMRLMRRRGISRPSYWHIHSYHSDTPEQVRQAWSKFQNWYATWGNNAPVVFSEVCATNIPDQRPVMDEFRELLARGGDNGVAGVYWFATHPTPVVDWPNACLCRIIDDGCIIDLTPLGEHWRNIR